MFVFRFTVQAMFCLDAAIGVGLCFGEEARNSVQCGTASFSWHLLAIEQCREKKDQTISLGNYLQPR